MGGRHVQFSLARTPPLSTRSRCLPNPTLPSSASFSNLLLCFRVSARSNFTEKGYANAQY